MYKQVLDIPPYPSFQWKLLRTKVIPEKEMVVSLILVSLAICKQQSPHLYVLCPAV